MFFFDYGTLTPEEELYLSTHSENVVERLVNVGVSKGLRNSDIIKLTKMPASKTSKLINKKQKLSLEDLKCWSKALGFTPHPFVQKEFDVREYSLSDLVRNIGELLSAIYDRRNDNNEQNELKDMVTYEFPLSVISKLNVEPSDFVSEGKITCGAVDVFDDKESQKNKGISIKFYHKNAVFEDKDILVEYFISPDRSIAVLGLFKILTGFGNPQPARIRDKDILMIDDNDLASWDAFYRDNESWVPRHLREAEIVSVIYDMESLPSEDELESDLQMIYDKYCDLVYDKTGGLDIRGRTRLAQKGIESRTNAVVFEKYDEIKKLIVSDLVSRGNGVQLIKQNDEPNVSRFIRSAGRTGLMLRVSGCESDYWKFRITGLQGFSIINVPGESNRPKNYPAEAVRLLSEVSEVFLEDVWYPEKMNACKYSFVFRDREFYEAFNTLIEDKSFNNWFSNILVDTESKTVVEEYVYKRYDGQTKKSPLDYPVISDFDEDE